MTMDKALKAELQSVLDQQELGAMGRYIGPEAEDIAIDNGEYNPAASFSIADVNLIKFLKDIGNFDVNKVMKEAIAHLKEHGFDDENKSLFIQDKVGEFFLRINRLGMLGVVHYTGEGVYGINPDALSSVQQILELGETSKEIVDNYAFSELSGDNHVVNDAEKLFLLSTAQFEGFINSGKSVEDYLAG